jgi:hypothetical protein
MYCQGLFCGDARSDRRGSRLLLLPVCTQQYASLLEMILERRVANVIDGDTFSIGQDQHISETRDLPVKRFEPISGSGKQFIHRVLSFPDAARR